MALYSIPVAHWVLARLIAMHTSLGSTGAANTTTLHDQSIRPTTMTYMFYCNRCLIVTRKSVASACFPEVKAMLRCALKTPNARSRERRVSTPKFAMTISSLHPCFRGTFLAQDYFSEVNPEIITQDHEPLVLFSKAHLLDCSQLMSLKTVVTCRRHDASMRALRNTEGTSRSHR